MSPTPDPSDTSPFEEYESNVRSYCRSFPTVFTRSKGAEMWDARGRRYLDFFAGAGSLNYGHNPDFIKGRLISYLQEDSVLHALDMYTAAKRSFIQTFAQQILRPRGLDYKLQFCGPTGANAVEAALKLVRKYTGRPHVLAFTGGWHGLSLGALSVTSNRDHRAASGVPLHDVTFLPYSDGPRPVPAPLEHVENYLTDVSSGGELPAAVILECVQAEGGIFAASPQWLQGLRKLCDQHQILMIVDDIQAGCGRTGKFFSFEHAGIVPDLVTLSKSISGYGLPMSLVLMKRALDVWKPAEHTGTFRGHQLAFVGGQAALEQWGNPHFLSELAERGAQVRGWLDQKILPLHPRLRARGVGMIWGVDLTHCGGPALAKQVSSRCFENGLIIERCGRDDTVLKLLPPLTIPAAQLAEGCAIIEGALREALAPGR